MGELVRRVQRACELLRLWPALDRGEGRARDWIERRIRVMGETRTRVVVLAMARRARQARNPAAWILAAVSQPGIPWVADEELELGRALLEQEWPAPPVELVERAFPSNRSLDSALSGEQVDRWSGLQRFLARGVTLPSAVAE